MEHYCIKCKGELFTIVSVEGKKVFECLQCGSKSKFATKIKGAAPLTESIFKREYIATYNNTNEKLLAEWLSKWTVLVNNRR